MIKQIHVIECDSTQDVLKEQLKQVTHTHLLVSCENQKSDRGRGDKKWSGMPGTLCFSFNLRPHKVLSYTALELSVIVAMYFEEKGKHLKLKWPNDLWDEQSKKCGGILVQGSQNEMLAGIGINLFSDDDQYGAIYEAPYEMDKKEQALEIAEFIHHNRFEDTDLLRREWLLRCGHLNQMVKVSEGAEVFEGIFQGLGIHGEAEICCDAQITRLYNGSLRLSSQA